MNPILHEAAQHVRHGWIMGVVTLLFVAGFVYWVWQAWSGRNRARWEAASRLPFSEEEDA